MELEAEGVMIVSGQPCMGRAGCSAAGLGAQARSERELADIKELGVRMFKQVGLV